MRSTIPALTLVAALSLALPVSAATFTVGPGGDCTHPTLQAALDSAAANSGADEVRIVRTATWTGIQVSTDTNQDVTIVGGWTACSSQQPTGKTTLDGTGGQARSVVALRGNGNFTLRNLEITGGDQAGDDDGGGVHFQGGGILRIEDSEIAGNEAEDGGGIYAQGTTTTAELIIGANVSIAFNVARRNGGGVVAQNLEMTMIAPGSVLWFNTAGGRGGGLLVASGDFPSYAYIGSSGIGDTGPVYSNQAAIGGGIAVVGGENSGRRAQVQVFSITSAAPVRIRGNSASQRGGGIDLQPDGDVFSGNADAIATLRHAALEENTAPVGAAINLSYDNFGPIDIDVIGGRVDFNLDGAGVPLHPAAAACPFGAPCGFIRNNSTGNTTGAVVHQSNGAYFHGSRIAIEGNQGGWLMYVSGGHFHDLKLDNSLIAGNTVQNALIRDDQNFGAYEWRLVVLDYLTITGNTIGANGVLSINEDMLFTRSLIDQPGKALFATDVGSTGGIHDIEYVIANTTTAPGGTTLAAPRFVDPANGDYMPRAGSRAVDYAPPLAAYPVDLYSHTRTIDLPVKPNALGASDVGALEREYLQPLVLNSTFDTDLNLWVAPGSAWDGTQNITGPTGSGSLRGMAAVDAARSIVGKQCIHLPGPGIYSLNGWGRVTATPPFTPPNRVWLDWELRWGVSQDDGCNNAATIQTGSLQLASGNTWRKPMLPVTIDATFASGAFATLTVYLVVENGSPIAPGPNGTVTPAAVLGGGPDGWFDGITLETGFDDTIFRDGFE
ncbi:MAG: hypothetical protein J0L88_11410 [Xanthomonadales bacterium]|nr:hypothetical protein [Xanthomonadales bacterium]